MKILITGGKGQLGSDCAQVLGASHDIRITDLDELDITNLSEVRALAGKFCPDIILNCAAYTQVDACETQQELAWQVNVTGPENLALCAQDLGCKLIHISTDYVFDGKKPVPEPYVEDDTPNPLSYYGKTKLESERAVQRNAEQHIILRVAWMYGMSGHNFLKTMLKLALNDSRKTIRVVSDQFGSPTWSYRLALQIARLSEENAQGIYHATSEGHCSWYELASYFLEKMAVPHRIEPCATQEYPTPAPRPRNSILENQRLRQEGANLMGDWKKDVDQFVGKNEWKKSL